MRTAAERAGRDRNVTILYERERRAAYHDGGTAVRAMREGAADFLCKPFDLRALRAVLDRLLGSQATRRPPDPVRPRTVRPAPVSPGADLMHGLLAERHALEGEVGRGAMAVVYRARDRRHDRDVAVKVMRREVALSIGGDRFLDEIRITARLQHPHILTLIDSGEWEAEAAALAPARSNAAALSRAAEALEFAIR